MKAIDYSGRNFGLLTLVCFYKSVRYGNRKRRFYKAKCQCGNEVIVNIGSVRNNNIKSCGCLRKRKGQENPKWKGYGEISGNNWDYIKSRCNRTWGGVKRKKSISFKISIKEAWNLFLQQGRKCVLSGQELTFGKNKTASLDRIDSSKGYVKGNIQWVHKNVNLMKQSLPQQEFIKLCKMVASNV